MPENLSDSSEVLPEDPAPNEIAEPVSLTTQVETEREEEMEEVDQQHQPSDNWIESGAADTPVALTASPVSDTKIVELDSMRNISQPVANDDYRQSIIDEIDSMESSPSLEYSDESEEELLAKAALEAFAYTSGSGVAASSAQQEIIPEISKVTTPINGMIEELAEAFASASRELEEFPAIDDDIRIAQNIDQNTIEETQLLFNLAAKNLLGDPSDTDYLDELLTSDKREVSSEDLDGVLKSTEESIDRSRLSLGIKDHDIDKLRRSIHREEKSVDLFGSHNRKPLPASTKKRAFCFAVDCVASILIGVAATLFVAICFAPELKDKLVHFGEQELYESLPLFSLGIVSIMFAFVTYPIIAFYLFKQTFGAYLSGTKIVREDYRRAHLSNIIARTILLPISLMLMGWLPLLFGRRAAHDWLSRTRVVI